MPAFRLIALAVLVLSLAACKPAVDAPVPAGAAAAGTPPSGPVTLEGEHADSIADAEPALPPLGEFRLVSVLLGSAVDGDNVVLADRREFSANDTIYASVLSTGAHQGLRLSATWLAPDGSTIADTSQPVVPTTATATTFSIRNPQAWPPGDYKVSIAINGNSQRTESFRIR